MTTDIDKAVAAKLRSAADVICDRDMPLCVCDRCGNHAEAAKVRRIVDRLYDEADRIDPDGAA